VRVGDDDELRFLGEFVKAAKLTPKVCGHDSKRWEDWIFAFAERDELQVGRCLYLCIAKFTDET
jgi:hypothetical protein